MWPDHDDPFELLQGKRLPLLSVQEGGYLWSGCLPSVVHQDRAGGTASARLGVRDAEGPGHHSTRPGRPHPTRDGRGTRDPEPLAKTLAERLSDNARLRRAYQDQQAAGLMTLEELASRLEE